MFYVSSSQRKHTLSYSSYMRDDEIDFLFYLLELKKNKSFYNNIDIIIKTINPLQKIYQNHSFEIWSFIVVIVSDSTFSSLSSFALLRPRYHNPKLHNLHVWPISPCLFLFFIQKMCDCTRCDRRTTFLQFHHDVFLLSQVNRSKLYCCLTEPYTNQPNSSQLPYCAKPIISNLEWMVVGE